MSTIFGKLKKKNSIWKYNLIKPYLKGDEKILDVGCGDLGLSMEIASHFKKINITGIDVIPLKKSQPKNRRVSFVRYDGEKMPFTDNTFEIAIVFYVLHHCDNPEQVIKECSRVTRKRVIVVESIPHNNSEVPFMRFFDWFFNFIKFDMTPLPYNFFTVTKWKGIFKKSGLNIVTIYHPKSYVDYFPFGKLYILEFTK